MEKTLEEILTLDQVRECLGEECEGISEEDLECVRSEAALVLGKIAIEIIFSL